MRPSDAFGFRRPTDNDMTPMPLQTAPSSAAAQQMTYFLADEATVDASLEQSLPSLHRPRDPRKHQPAERLDTSIISSAPASPAPSPRATPVGMTSLESSFVDAGRSMAIETPELRPVTPPSRPPLSQPMTPIMLGTPGGQSSAALSSTSSRRNSLTGSCALSEDLEESAAVAAAGMSTSGEEGSGTQTLSGQASSGMMDSGSAPQLIMPSIKMPSRRPFTEEGKRIGRLKVLIAGASGIGKTSLIKAIVQSCEHIVHVDSITPSSVSLATRRSSRSTVRQRSSRSETTTSHITEIYASTKPYPEWWSDIDEFRALRRRKSLGDSVLDRNICFVDTPGLSHGSSAMETIAPVIDYIETQLEKLSSNSLSDSETLNLVGGDGGSQVDAVFYMISAKLTSADLEYLRRLAPLTNIIPVLALADTMDSTQLAESKEIVTCQLQEASIRPFTFAYPLNPTVRAVNATCPYAISSALGPDHDTMDASLLMSPEYIQPLIPTDLSALVEQVFSQEGVSWLRHSAARKYVLWKGSSENTSRPQALYRPLSYPTPAMGAPDQRIRTHPVGPTSSFAMARVADHTQREERLAQIRLANWASELQRSLANERARYEALANSERAVWLTERLNECVQDGTLVPVGRGRRNSARGRESGFARRFGDNGSGSRTASKGLKYQDPLGLLDVTADIKAKGWAALELIGGLGVLGGLALWMSRHYCHSQVYQWLMEEWGRIWYGD